MIFFPWLIRSAFLKNTASGNSLTLYSSLKQSLIVSMPLYAIWFRDKASPCTFNGRKNSDDNIITSTAVTNVAIIQ